MIAKKNETIEEFKIRINTANISYEELVKWYFVLCKENENLKDYIERKRLEL